MKKYTILNVIEAYRDTDLSEPWIMSTNHIHLGRRCSISITDYHIDRILNGELWLLIDYYNIMVLECYVNYIAQQENDKIHVKIPN